MRPGPTPHQKRLQTGLSGISRDDCIGNPRLARGFIVAVFGGGVGVSRFGHACAIAHFGRGVAVGVEADRRGICVIPMGPSAVRWILRRAHRAWIIVHRSPVPPDLHHPRIASCSSIALAVAGVLPRLRPIDRILALHPKLIEYVLRKPIPGIKIRPIGPNRHGALKISKTSASSGDGARASKN